MSAIVLLAAAVVKASSFCWNAEDSTLCLQKALDSGAATVIVDRQASDWIVRPLFITNSNIEVVLEDGVAVRAKRGEYYGIGDCLIRITGGCSNVVLRGEGAALLAMNKTDYQDPSRRYDFSEWRHAVAILDARDVTVKDLTILSSGGDGVYPNGPKNVLLENLKVHNHHRQGMSPISVNGLMVRNCEFNATRGTAPQSGIDMEPNAECHMFEDVVYEDCVFNDNAAHGIDIYVGFFTKRTRPLSITFRRCLARGNGGCGVTFMTGNPAYILARGHVGGFVRFEDCRFEQNAGEALKVMNHTENGVDISFARCTFDARGSRAESAIMLSNSQLAADFGGLTFDDCTVLVDKGRNAFDFEAPRGIGIAGLLKGIVRVSEGEGTAKPFDLAAFRAKFEPHPELVTHFKSATLDFMRMSAPLGVCTGLLSPAIRTRFVFVQAVPKAGEYPIRFSSARICTSGTSTTCAVVQLLDKAGTDLGKFEIPEGDFAYVLKANGPNVFRFEISPRNTGIVRVSSTTPGAALTADQSFGFFHGADVNLYFRVPRGSKEVLVDMRPEERVSAQLLDASGKVVDEMPFQRAGKVLKGMCTPVEDEIWTLRFPSIEEDFRFQLGGDAVPLVSLEREAVIR